MVYVGLNAGDDSIAITGGGSLAMLPLVAVLAATQSFCENLSSITSSTIKGGDNADIQTTSGLSTSIVNGNKGADTIVISTTASADPLVAVWVMTPLS